MGERGDVVEVHHGRGALDGVGYTENRVDIFLCYAFGALGFQKDVVKVLKHLFCFMDKYFKHGFHSEIVVTQ
jgi:hypothetical protein